MAGGTPATLIRGLCAAEFAFLHPWEVGANFFAELLDGMFRATFHERIVHGPARLVFRDPFLRELAALDFFQNLLHLGAGLLRDDTFAAGDVAILGGIT